jgi:hypothetical protein
MAAVSRRTTPAAAVLGSLPPQGRSQNRRIEMLIER